LWLRLRHHQRRALSLPILLRETFVAHAKIDNPLDESDKRWNKRPAEKYIQDALSNTTEIKFVDAKAAKKEREKASSDPVAAAGSHGTKGPWR
jgi:hypothetical protein